MSARFTRYGFGRPTLIALFAAAVGSGLFLISQKETPSSASAHSPTAPAIVATVDGHTIPSAVFFMYLRNGIEALGLSDQTDEGKRNIERLKRAIIDDLIDRVLIEKEALRAGLVLSDSQIADAFAKKVREMGGDEMYRSYLSKHRLTEDDFRSIIRQEELARMLKNEITRSITVPDDEVRSFYDRERSNPAFAILFKEPERVRASHILIAARRAMIESEIKARGKFDKTVADSLVSQEIAKRRQRANLILERARRGEDFGRLAREHSDDPATRERGGDLGLFTRNTHTRHFDEAAFAIRPGRISDVVETEFGFHIIKVASHHPERIRRLDETAVSIRELLHLQKQAARLKEWLEDRRRNSAIQIEPYYRVDRQ